LSAFRVFQRLVNTYLGVGAWDRLSRYVYDGAYGLPQMAGDIDLQLRLCAVR